MPGPDSVAAIGLLYTDEGRHGRSRALATGFPTNGDCTRTSRFDAVNAFDLIYRDAGRFYQSISSILVGPVIGSSILMLFGRSEFDHFGGEYLLLENRADTALIVDRLAGLPVEGWTNTTWDGFTTSACVVHAERATEFRISARAAFAARWNTEIDRVLEEAGGSAERVGEPSFRWSGFRDANAKITFDPIGSYHFLTVSQRLRLHGPNVIPDYDGSMMYDIALAPDGDAVTGWVQAWNYGVSDGLFHDYMAALLKPYVALGAEQLSDALERVPLPLPQGMRVRDLYYLPGDQSSPQGQQVIRSGKAWGDATIVLELGTG